VATSFYDVVILGGDLAATVAGAVLAHRGFRVLAAGVPVEERYSVGPYNLPRAPLAFVGLEGPTLRRVVSELNLVQLLRRRLEPNRPAFQLLLEDQRIDIGDEVAREIAREMPSASAEFEALSTRMGEISSALEAILSQDLILPPEGFWDRRDASRVGARLPDDATDLAAPLGPDHPLRALVRLPAAFTSDLSEPGAIAQARLGDLHRRGTFRIDGGRQGLRALLLERLKTHSGEVRPDLIPTAIEVKRGRAEAIHFEGKSESVGCGHVLCGLGADAVTAMITGDKPPKRLHEAAQIQPGAWRYLLHLVAPLDALPDALGRFAFSLTGPADAPLTNGNALALHLADGYGQHAVLSVEALATDPSREALVKLRARVRQRLDALFPFVDKHLLLVHSPHDGLPPERADGHAAPPPESPEPLWNLGGDRTLGVGGLPHGTGLKNVLLASRQVLPGIGLEGELAAGWGAARLILQKERKRDLVKGAVLEG
jgi:phytoene dehydrogenase-like protein